ncbi:hypothetical protein CSC70_08590 [Pseudoxanthomonas kalamensis DSM 18571]|uniref:LapA family protein n=1 Tax=Pseudoxanthomonas kalamensis TaxID=289483 RepID=UPI0013920511|nr:LapA family protein [Pseudoxanthomonas kalamensis]KAF1709749.1 hypothetical protein CSC70_08590 [Pseudoxanthomonas kalamensis DSM 18571]
MSVPRLLAALLFLLVGLLIGIWNTDAVTVSFPFLGAVKTTSGVAIIVSLLSGVLIGGLLVVAAVVWPMYAKLRKANKTPVATPVDGG